MSASLSRTQPWSSRVLRHGALLYPRNSGKTWPRRCRQECSRAKTYSTGLPAGRGADTIKVAGKHGDVWTVGERAVRTENNEVTASDLTTDASFGPPRDTSLLALRDACTCALCVDPHSGQKRFATADVPDDLRIAHAAATPDGHLALTWRADFLTGADHTSVYPARLWRRARLRAHQDKPPASWQRRSWAAHEPTSPPPFYAYDAFARDGRPYLDAMHTLLYCGMVILRDVPADEAAVERVAARLGLLQHTLYGATWDVRSKPAAENVAYTSQHLAVHQDLLYLENVPRLQILHCLENTCPGGESLFCDGHRVASELIAASRDRKPDRKPGHDYSRSPMFRVPIRYH